ncbi:alpha/beta fold hydrolase [Mucilaginibacter arboris]|uniref:Alpha/beta fold hydrolase n=1 Tax=Mucilaginibacter arboris TaxID=2682090 RepID=A0A7K1SYZ0_9SPHI|nr:alpha/beta hydrolase [Mucilaginibacter arboris]MVN22477.1 alpha/beta fold hydrolase [Mucilaginibacter arboris]
MTDILKRNNVKIFGNGKETILFAHGFGGDQKVWKYVYNAFTENYRVILFDYVGSGNSDHSAYKPELYNSLRGFAQDVLDICAALQLHQVIYVGHSVSSMIGLLAALEEPDYFQKLIFLGPSARYLNDGDYIGGLERSDLDGLFEMLDNNYLGFSQMMAPAIMGEKNSLEKQEELTESFIAADPAISQNFARVTLLSDHRHKLPFLTVPSLTVQCMDDVMAPETAGQYIHENTIGNIYLELHTSGHCPHLSAPEKVIKAIKDYIKTEIFA